MDRPRSDRGDCIGADRPGSEGGDHIGFDWPRLGDVDRPIGVAGALPLLGGIVNRVVKMI